MNRILFIFVGLSVCIYTYAQRPVRDILTDIQTAHNIHFIYEATLNLDIPYQGPDIRTKSLKKQLQLVFKNTNINYEILNKNIILTSKLTIKKEKIFRLYGHVMDANGEPIIHATIIEHNTGKEALTDEHGRYSLTLSEGKHTIYAASIENCFEKKEIYIETDTLINFKLIKTINLQDVKIVATHQQKMQSQQTGIKTYTHKDFQTNFALLSSPDLIKILQQNSGIGSGIDLTSELFVHGGQGDENQFLIDGAPLYQIGHSLGLFSSFNTDIIKSADFYKSEFPAQYNGNLSSVTDIHIFEGNREKLKGQFSIGLLDGRIALEGPIIDKNTTFVFGLRRSWIDLLMRPTFSIINKHNENSFSINYVFYDLNAKITRYLPNNNIVWLSLYNGGDNYSTDNKDKMDILTQNTTQNYTWDNINVSFGTDLSLTPTTTLRTVAYHVSSNTNHQVTEHEENITNNSFTKNTAFQQEKSAIKDYGIKSNIKSYISENLSWNAGLWLQHHQFIPQNLSYTYQQMNNKKDTLQFHQHTNTKTVEFNGYIENEWSVSPSIFIRMGLNYLYTKAQTKNYGCLNPRLAATWNMSKNISFKVSFTKISQAMHRISSSYLDLPSDAWIPTTLYFAPSQSFQYVLGLYGTYDHPFTFSIEGFIK